MTSNKFDLEERTLKFAQRVNAYVLGLPKNIANLENGRQLIRSSGSVGANYIEANEALGKKDFIMRLRISRKEAKESRHWLRLTLPDGGQLEEQKYLIQEASELVKILSSMINKTSTK